MSADVLLSTDCLDLEADARGECHAAANFNTGVLYLRSTQGARRFTALWAERMAHVGPEPWLDDQSVLNDMVRQGLGQLPPRRRSSGGGSRLYSTTGVNVTIGLRRSRTSPTAIRSLCSIRLPLSAAAQKVWCRDGALAGASIRVKTAATRWPGAPLAVHTTYQYGDAAAFAYGKFTRLLQSGLWTGQPYTLAGPALDAALRHRRRWRPR